MGECPGAAEAAATRLHPQVPAWILGSSPRMTKAGTWARDSAYSTSESGDRHSSTVRQNTAGHNRLIPGAAAPPVVILGSSPRKAKRKCQKRIGNASSRQPPQLRASISTSSSSGSTRGSMPERQSIATVQIEIDHAPSRQTYRGQDPAPLPPRFPSTARSGITRSVPDPRSPAMEPAILAEQNRSGPVWHVRHAPPFSLNVPCGGFPPPPADYLSIATWPGPAPGLFRSGLSPGSSLVAR